MAQNRLMWLVEALVSLFFLVLFLLFVFRPSVTDSLYGEEALKQRLEPHSLTDSVAISLCAVLMKKNVGVLTIKRMDGCCLGLGSFHCILISVSNPCCSRSNPIACPCADAEGERGQSFMARMTRYHICGYGIQFVYDGFIEAGEGSRSSIVAALSDILIMAPTSQVPHFPRTRWRFSASSALLYVGFPSSIIP